MGKKKDKLEEEEFKAPTSKHDKVVSKTNKDGLTPGQPVSEADYWRIKNAKK